MKIKKLLLVVSVLTFSFILFACSSKKTFKISFLQDDAVTILYSYDAIEGSNIEYKGVAPTKTDNDYTYVFAGWDHALGVAVNDEAFIAQYTKTPKSSEPSLPSGSIPTTTIIPTTTPIVTTTATPSTTTSSPTSSSKTTTTTSGNPSTIDDYYLNVDTSSGEALLSSLFRIINPHTDVGYGGLWNVFQKSDVKPGYTDVYWDMYSNYNYKFGASSNYRKEGDGVNREHSVPQSWFNERSPMKSDAFHVYPTDGYVNNRRGNYLYGETDSPTYTSENGSKLGPSSFAGYSGTVFEPIDEYKGDFARTYFYMATCYSDRCGAWGHDVFKNGFPYLTNYAVSLFTKWAKEDPVSEKEIIRNNAIYEFQHNRNPFIDHPEYIDIIYGA